jgi:hypothetical protein
LNVKPEGTKDVKKGLRPGARITITKWNLLSGSKSINERLQEEEVGTRVDINSRVESWRSG